MNSWTFRREPINKSAGNERRAILVVEDDAVVATDIANTLTNFGYRVVGPLAKGEDVLEKLDSLAPDLILLDIKLDGELDGIQVAEQLQNRVPIPIVFLSALNDEETLRRVKIVKPFGYLIKPFDVAELRAVIELTIDRFSSEDHQKYPEENEEAIGDNVEILQHLQRIDIFADVSKVNLSHLAQSTRIKEVIAGEFLSFEQEEADAGFVPLMGRVRVSKSSSSGKELIVSLVGPWDASGLLNLLPALSGATSSRAQVDSKLLWIPRDAWSALLAKEPCLYRNISQVLAQRLNASHSLSSSLAHARVEGRIINTLLALLPQFGKPISNSSNEGRLFITRKELSELTGTTPETAIRVTKALERQSLLDLTRPGIIKILDIHQLREVVTD